MFSSSPDPTSAAPSRYSLPVAVIIGLLAQVAVLGVGSVIALLLLALTNPDRQAAGGDTLENEALWPIAIVCLLPSIVPWMVFIITARLSSWRETATGMRVLSVLLGVAGYVGILFLVFCAGFILLLSSVVCPVDAYECPL